MSTMKERKSQQRGCKLYSTTFDAKVGAERVRQVAPARARIVWVCNLVCSFVCDRGGRRLLVSC
jgi:hypothetical protein